MYAKCQCTFWNPLYTVYFFVLNIIYFFTHSLTNSLILQFYLFDNLFFNNSLIDLSNFAFFHQTGVSRHLFERWCDDERNGVVLAGYTVEGTLAHDLLNHPTGKKL